MSKLRTILTVAISALVACGGAGTTAVPTAQSQAQLQGSILEVDGQTIDRDGIEMEIVETGDRIRSGADGTLRFPDLDTGRYTLDFNPGAPRTLALEGEEEQDGEKREEEQENDGEERKEEEEREEEESKEEEEREEEEREDEKEEDDDERDEDEFGRPRVEIDREGPVVVIKVVLENGEVVRWSKSHPNHRFVRARMERAEGSDARGQIRLREWYRGERESLRFIACGLDGGDVVDVYLRDTTVEGAEYKKIGSREANGEGCASLAFDTKGGWLPLEAESLSDLAGFEVQVRMAADGTVILSGEIPALPERVERHEKEEEKEREEEEKKEEEEGEREEKPEVAPAAHGKDRLIAQLDFVFGSVEIWDWDAKELQRFRMFAGGLDEGEKVRFEIRDPESEEWTTFATRIALVRGEEDGYVAKVDTEWFGVLPLDSEDVEQLIGLGVRVVRETEEGDVVLLIGEIPNLVRD